MLWTIAVFHFISVLSSDKIHASIRCTGKATFPSEENVVHNYCTYYYKFLTDDCTGKNGSFQGYGYFTNGSYGRTCGPLARGQNIYYIICVCDTDYCNSLEGVQSIMANTQRMTQFDVFALDSYPESDSSIRMYNCAKEDINAKYQVIREAEEAKKFMFFIILASVLGGVGIIVLLAILIPIFIKIRRYRHKKWLAETWEERVRKAATELNKQEGKEPNKVSTGRTRAERKAKKMAESKESKEKGSKEQGSKESVERGSKDMGSNENFQNEIFPSAFGPNERKMSVDGIGSREKIEGGQRW